MKKSIIYQVLPRLWKNGKFSDWQTESFDYLKSLKVDYVWFTGIMRHASGEDWVKGNPGCPFAITDFYDVNPYLADNPATRMKEFCQLVERTHDNGMGFIMDFIPNHTAKCGANSLPVTGWHDYDWSDTMKIDYSNQETWSRMLEIVLFWASKGVDGFRCDMVELVPQDFLSWLIAETRKMYPQTLFIGEVYNRQNYWRFAMEIGFDLLYDKSGMYDTLRAVTCSGMTTKSITWNWQSMGDFLKPKMLNFLENHDEQRVACPDFAGSPQKAYAALAVSLLFNESSFMIYSGQECGENASESDNGRTSIFDIRKPSSLENPDLKVLGRYRSILALASSDLIREGRNWDLCYCNSPETGFDPDHHFAFLRMDGKDAVLVVSNFSDFPATMNIHIPEETGLAPGFFNVTVPAWDYMILDLPV